MNLVLDETVEVVSTTEKSDIGMVVRTLDFSNVLEWKRSRNLSSCLSENLAAIESACSCFCSQVIRGNSVIQMESLDKI